MGTQNRRFGFAGDLSKIESDRQKLQYEIDNRKDLVDRRKCGQFATPYNLAREIAGYGLSLLQVDNISFLEPAMGTGAFLSALLQEMESSNKKLTRATGIEIDKELALDASNLWHNSDIDIINDDFTRISPDGKYNFLVTNPPYVRHHYIVQDEKMRLNCQVKKDTCIDLSGLSDLYCYFILLSHKWLADGAICGWLIPSEFMDVKYGATLKNYLLNDVHLLRVHRYNPADLKFGEALVSSCVVWFKNEKVQADYDVVFSYDGTLQHPSKQKAVRKSDLLKECTWSRFPEKEVRSDCFEPTLGEYFTIKRGIATGDNSFFILTKEKIDELKLDMKFFRPVLPSPRYLKTNFVEADEVGNPKSDPQYYLLNCDLGESEIKENYPELWRYLQSGIPETSDKCLCKGRRRWFCQEQRRPAKFLCSYMGRGDGDASPIRFILNLSEAVATNSYLMLYPKEKLQHAIDKDPEIVYRIWEQLKLIKRSAIEDEGRVYGGGLTKIEPMELANVSCVGLQMLCDTL